jgi:hypothetical protein
MSADQPFYKEQTRWAFVHATVPLAIYFATRNIVLTLLLIYVWETIEYILSRFISYLHESVGDSLVGDPVVGSLTVFSFWLLDQATDWDDAIVDVSGRRRFFCILVLFCVTPLIEIGQRTNLRLCAPHVGTLLYALAYAGVVLVFYVPHLGSTPIGQSVFVWLIIVALLALAAAPHTDTPSSFQRVVSMELLVLAAAFVAYIALQ